MHKSKVSSRRSGAAALAIAIVLAIASPAFAKASPRVVTIANVSRESPWSGLNCMSENFWRSGKPIVGEPTLAVNPLNPLAQAASWIDLDSGRIDAAFTEDGGQTWHKASLPGTDPCTGRASEGFAYEQGADPWLSYGVDGTLYLSSLMATNYAAPPPSKYRNWVYIQRADNNSDFTQPTVLESRYNDFPNILADNSLPGYVYVIYVIGNAGLPVGDGGRGAIHFARSTDGGETFEVSILASARPDSYVHPIVPDDEYVPGAAEEALEAYTEGGDGGEILAEFMRYFEENYFMRSQMVQLADGTIVVTSTFPLDLGGATRTLVSRDRGESWSYAANLPDVPHGAAALSRCNYSLGLPGEGSKPVVLNGNSILIVNSVNDGEDGPGRIVLRRSDDSGQSWSMQTVFESDLPIGLVRIATDAEGRIALAYDEAESSANIDCSVATPAVPVRTRFIVSYDDGDSWSDPITIGTDWWDAASGGARSGEEEGGGLFLGDYEDMAAVPGVGFAVTAIQGQPLTTDEDAVEITGYKSLIVAQVAVD